MEAASGTLAITHVITGIKPHGAELVLLRLVGETRDRCSHHIVVLSEAADLRAEFERAGATVTVIGLSRRRPNPLKFAKLASVIRGSRPDVVQTWLPAGDLLGGLSARLATRTPVVWNVRHSDHQPGRWGWPTRFAVRSNSVLSRWVPKRIIAVGQKPADAHVAIGYSLDKMTVIRNGFEIPNDVGDRDRARQELGLPAGSLVVSRLARFHDDKDFPTLMSAWATVVHRVPTALLVLAGVGLAPTNTELVELVESAGVTGSVVMLGPLEQPCVLYSASDLTVSSSLAEGLPNVIGEAMALGIPAVVTDVGDSALLVADTGRVVPPANPIALAHALVELLTMTLDDRTALGEAARQRIVGAFSMAAMGDAYVAVWKDVAHVRN